MKKENGFTLVEIIVALGVGMVIVAAMYSVINLTQRTSSGLEKRVVTQQDARGALELMAAEIRMASYNPNSRANIWVDLDCATVATDNLNYRGIREATDIAITVEMDINDDDAIDDPNEIIRYAYNAADCYITRSTNCGGAQAFLGDTNAHRDRKTVSVENSTAGPPGNEAIPVFRYFNGAGTEIFPTTADQSPIPNIRRIQITLVADTADDDVGSNTRRRIIYSTSVIPRNHFALIYN